MKLGRQPIVTAPFDIPGRKGARVNAAKHPLELRQVIALALLHIGEVDIQEDVVGQVGLSGGNNLVGQVGSQLAVDGANLGHGTGIPGEGAFVGASGEGNGGNLGVVGGVACCADGAGEGGGEPEVSADVGAGDGEFGGCTVPELRAKGVDAVFHGCDGEGVDPVEIRACGICADWTRVGRAAVVLAGLLTVCGWFISRALEIGRRR